MLGLVGTLIGYLPVAWLAWLRARGHHRNVAYRWLALAFLVSGLVDTAWYVIPADLYTRLSDLYPILQSAIIAAVFLTAVERWIVAGSLTLVGLASLLFTPGFDLLLATVAWLVVCGIVLDRWALGRLRTALLISFGGVLLALYAAHVWPGVVTNVLYQSVRLTGVLWFCAAAWKPGPVLLVLRKS